MRWFGKFLATVGLMSCILIAVQFTNVPWEVYGWLGSAGLPAMVEEPDYIVVLGGGGIPSESGLMRSYRAAEEARRFPNAMVAVAMTDSNDMSTVRMLDELVMRGVKRERILLEDKGRNTREQALNLHQLLYVDGVEPIVTVVTSTEHMRRALLSLRKAGFQNLCGACAEPIAITGQLEYESKDLGARRPLVPDVGGDLTIRYRIWNNFSASGRCFRELVALAYYKAMGWI